MASSEKSEARRGKASVGVTLLELAIGMVIMLILAIGVSALVKTGVESGMSERVHQNMQTIVLNAVDDIRLDIRKADSVQIGDGGNRLTLISFNTLTNADESTLYLLSSGGQLSRQDPSGQIKIYNDPKTYTDRLRISCAQGCFVADSLNSKAMPRQIRIPEMKVEEVLPGGNTGTLIDCHFGTANFALRDFAFDVISNTEFQ